MAGLDFWHYEREEEAGAEAAGGGGDRWLSVLQARRLLRVTRVSFQDFQSITI